MSGLYAPNINGMETNQKLAEVRTKINGWITDVHHTNIVETGDVINMLLDLNFMISEIISETELVEA